MNPWIEACGWSSSVMIAVHMLPQLVKVLKEKHADGLSLGMLRLWYWAEWLALPYAIYYKTWAVVFIIVSSLIQATVFIHYKKHPRREANG